MSEKLKADKIKNYLVNDIQIYNCTTVYSPEISMVVYFAEGYIENSKFVSVTPIKNHLIEGDAAIALVGADGSKKFNLTDLYTELDKR